MGHSYQLLLWPLLGVMAANVRGFGGGSVCCFGCSAHIGDRAGIGHGLIVDIVPQALVPRP